jgi:N utilization substance protein B
LLEGVRSHRAELDQTLARLAKNWTLGRMAVTDRNSLRLGAYELLHTDAPGPVAVYESVELAKRFGSSESAGFVNAILDKLRLEVAQQTAPIPETTSDDEQP